MVTQMSNYGTADGFRTYITARNLTATGSAVDATVIAALLVASEWLDANYRTLYSGRKTNGRDQAREWPRTGAGDVYGFAIASDAIPIEVENATYEAAIRELNTKGTLSQDYTPSKYDTAAVSGAVSVKYRHFSGAHEAQTRLQVVDETLYPILDRDAEYSPLSGSAGRA